MLHLSHVLIAQPDLDSFEALAEARVIIEDWRQDYNENRPHSSLGYETPNAFAAAHGLP